jgi:hypothetical protein
VEPNGIDEEEMKRYLESKMKPQFYEQPEAIMGSADAIRSAQESANLANMSKGFEQASAAFSGGRYKPNTEYLDDFGKSAQNMAGNAEKRLIGGQQQAGTDRKAAINEYLAGKKQEKDDKFKADSLEASVKWHNEANAVAKANSEERARNNAALEDLKRQNSELKVAGTGDTSKIGREYADKWDNHHETRKTREIQTAYGKMQNADANAPGDMSLIYGFMKMQDPTSTVREGEYAGAENTKGVSDTVLNLYEKVRHGTRLTPEQRTQFKLQGKGIYDAQLATQRQIDERFKGLAGINKVDPKNLLMTDWEKETPLAKVTNPQGGGFGTATAAPAAPPAKSIDQMSDSEVDEFLKSREVSQ